MRPSGRRPPRAASDFTGAASDFTGAASDFTGAASDFSETASGEERSAPGSRPRGGLGVQPGVRPVLDK